MSKKPGTIQDRGSNLRLPSNATPEDAMRAIFKIPADQAKRIAAGKPEKPGRKPKK